jgi:TatD DNase family protein
MFRLNRKKFFLTSRCNAVHHGDENNMYIDTHAHFDLVLEDPEINEETLMKNMEDRGIMHAVQVSIEPAGLQWSREFAVRNRHRGVLFTAGIHPSTRANDDDCSMLAAFVDSAVVPETGDLLFGIGECGLDYYRLRQPREMQIRSFEFQLSLAEKHGLPVIVHSRDAWKETMDILRSHKPSAGIMHCFPGDAAMAREALDLGFYLSFAGNVTYKKAEALHSSAAYVPADRLLIETDAPFLTPVPLRGRQNRTEYIINTYTFIADLRKCPVAEIQEAVYGNFLKLRGKRAA